MTYSPQPASAQVPAKRPRWAWLLSAGVALIVALGCAGNSASDSTGDDKPAAAAAGKATKGAPKQDSSTAGLNQPARDGDFQFTVTKLKCGVSHVGTDLLGQDAQGQ